jgi:hypothetical protein
LLNSQSENFLNSHSIIENCINVTKANIERALKSFSSLSENQLNWKINHDSWSVGECLSHLVNTNNLYLNKIKSIIKSNTSGIEKDFSYKQSLSGKMITKGIDPDNKRKTKTFKVFFPDSSDIHKSIIQDYVKSSDELVALAKKMIHLDLKKIRLSSPVNILIRLNLGDPLIIIPKHDERHLNQAERVKNHNEFPKK